MRVGDLMATELITVEPHHDLGIALALMYEFDIRRLPVVDTETGMLVGIISDRDVRLAISSPFLGQGDQQAVDELESILVGDVMSTDLVVIGPHASVADAARRMLSHKVSGLPVVELDAGGTARVVGIITSTDLLRHLASLNPDRETRE
jgi:CBS domain-containing protein